MFTEVNDLNFLIIDLDSFSPQEDMLWENVLNAIECLFVVKDPARILLFEQQVSVPADFIVHKPRFIDSLGSLISEALHQAKKHPFETAYVTASFYDIRSVLNEPIGSIYISEKELKASGVGHLPDFKLNNINDLTSVLQKKTGYFSEVCSTFINRKSSFSSSGYALNFKLPCGENTCHVVFGGRYYAPRHIKSYFHQLSRRILRSKDYNTQEDLFADILLPLVNCVNEEFAQVDGVSRVPSRPGKRDRLRPLVKKICDSGDYDNFTDALQCIKDYPSQKEFPSKQEREENVKGKFKASPYVKGKHIVVIDDIITTGSTVLECAKTLYEAGAEKVSIVVLGINQHPPQPFRKIERLKCKNPNCDGEMVLRFFSYDKGLFWGCGKYRENGCSGVDFLPGWQEINSANTLEECYPNEDDEDILNF